MCELAAPFGLTPVVEFVSFSAVPTLGQAIDLVQAAGRPEVGILFDMLREMMMWMSQDEEWGREMRDINNYYNLDRINTFSLRRKVAKHVIEAGGYAL